MSYKRVVDINNFDFGVEPFDGDKAKWPAFAQQAKTTAGINEGRYKGLLRCHLMAVRAWLTWMEKQPGSELWPIDHETFLYVNSEEDEDQRDHEEDLYRVGNTAFLKSLGPTVKKYLKKANGNSIDDVPMRTLMTQLYEKYGTVTPSELSVISAPLSVVFDEQGGVSIDTHVDSHVSTHDDILFFDNGKHAMPEALKITTLCDSLRGCNLYTADIKFVTGKKLATFDEWAEAFKESVADTPITSTTGNTRYAARAAAVTPAAPRQEQMLNISLRDYEAALAAKYEAAMAARIAAMPPPAKNSKKREREYTHWCYIHGDNNSHDNDTCRRVHEIPADKMESNAENKMGGPKKRPYRRY